MCYYRDLIKVLKWHIDRVTEVELHDHIQEVLKVINIIELYIWMMYSYSKCGFNLGSEAEYIKMMEE